MAKARLRRGIEIVKLANRIEALKMQEDDIEEAPGQADVPADAKAAAGAALSGVDAGAGLSKTNTDASASSNSTSSTATGEKRSLSKIAKGAIFREVVLAKVRDMKEAENQLKVANDAKDAENNAAKRKSSGA